MIGSQENGVKEERMRIIYAGNGERGRVCLRALLKVKKNVVLDISDEKDVNSKKSIKKIKEARPDLIILAGFNQIIRKELISIPPKGIINLHGGKLPKYRGSSVMNWQIILGEKEGGVAIIQLDEGIDTGDIIAQETYPIREDDTIKDVIDNTLRIFPRLLLGVVKQIEDGTVKPVKQGSGKVHKHRNPGDGRLYSAGYHATAAHNFVRALTHPLPGAFVYFRKKKVYLWKAELIEGWDERDHEHDPGRIIKTTSKGAVLRLGHGAIMVRIVQEDGGVEIDAGQYFRKGDVLDE